MVLNVGTTFVPEERAMVGDVDKRGMDEVTDLLTPSPFVEPGTEDGREGGRDDCSLQATRLMYHLFPPSLSPSLPAHRDRRGRP